MSAEGALGAKVERFMPKQPVASSEKKRLPVELWDDIKPTLHNRALIKGMLLAGTLIVVFGHPGSGKSFYASHQGFCIATNRSWFGRKVTKGGVVLIAAEGQAGMRMRIDAWKREHGPFDEPVQFALIPTAVDLFDPEADLQALAQELIHLADAWGGLALLIVDTLSATIGGGDESTGDMAVYVANIARLCAPYQCARMIVHHQPLDSASKRPRGHGSLWGTADTVIHIIGDTDAPVRRARVTKQKDMDPGADTLFALKSVEIGTDEDGEIVTSCVVEEAEDDVPVKGSRRLSAKEKIVLSALERTVVEHGRFPPLEIPDSVLNRARTGKVVSLSEWRSNALSALNTPDTKPDTARRTFDRAREALQAAEILAVWEEWAWLVF
jgi:hypothetical protein